MGGLWKRLKLTIIYHYPHREHSLFEAEGMGIIITNMDTLLRLANITREMHEKAYTKAIDMQLKSLFIHVMIMEIPDPKGEPNPDTVINKVLDRIDEYLEYIQSRVDEIVRTGPEEETIINFRKAVV